MKRTMMVRCQALDMNGRRCGSKKGVEPVEYHGDGDLYGSCYGRPEPGWVRVLLCEKHRKPRRASREGER